MSNTKTPKELRREYLAAKEEHEKAVESAKWARAAGLFEMATKCTEEVGEYAYKFLDKRLRWEEVVRRKAQLFVCKRSKCELTTYAPDSDGWVMVTSSGWGMCPSCVTVIQAEEVQDG